MQRQAVPCLRPQAPLVGTGMERKIAFESGQCLISDVEGKVIEVDANHISIKTKDKKNEVYKLINFGRSNKNSWLMQKPVIKKDDVNKKGYIISRWISYRKWSFSFRAKSINCFYAVLWI